MEKETAEEAKQKAEREDHEEGTNAHSVDITDDEGADEKHYDPEKA